MGATNEKRGKCQQGEKADTRKLVVYQKYILTIIIHRTIYICRCIYQRTPTGDPVVIEDICTDL